MLQSGKDLFLFFLHAPGSLLGQHHDRRVERRVVGGHVLDLLDQAAQAVMFDPRLAQQLLVVALKHRFGGGIEDFFLDRGMHGQGMADAECQLALFDVVGRLAVALEFPHQLVDFVVIRGQQDEGVVGIDVRLAGVPLGMRGFLARDSHRSLHWLAVHRWIGTPEGQARLRA